MKLFTQVIVDFETNPKEYGLQFMNKTFDTCRFYNSKRFEPFLQILYNVALENESVLLPRRCPVKTGVYYVVNASIETDKIPPFSPTTKGARLDIKYFVMEKQERMKPILMLKFYFKLQKK
ncbi:hypothetical protein Bhyg_16025 [Pseudolycoriella hygida]|uniref:Uncharacterized protein n=1 Tax=Pseudolycoriella hygida TaxID=35572 RepID=A0A9Q0ML94_9DIPT|nr:hypothetical protein Bhyg_16025 [Pseudolycoriella hygida]